MGSLIGQGIVGIVLPALLALILNGLVLRAALAESRKWPFIGLIIAGCFAFSYSVLLGGIAFPPREATHWLPFIAVGAVVFGTILQFTSGVGRSAGRLIAALATAWTVLQLQIFGRWPLPISLEWLVAVTLILFATSRLIERAGVLRNTPTEILLGMALAAGFGGVEWLALFRSTLGDCRTVLARSIWRLNRATSELRRQSKSPTFIAWADCSSPCWSCICRALFDLSAPRQRVLTTKPD